MSDPESDAVPTIAGGRFELTKLLGRGGMAKVWRARDTQLGVDRAIKIIQGRGRARTIRGRRLRNEARAMARLAHPHVVQVHDVVDTDEGPAIVMDLVPGGTLDDRVRARGALPPASCVVWIIQILDALHAAHALGIVHRDVKPSNILVSADGQALLLDFGIALLSDEDRHTRTGISMGSVAYMAPEQRLDAARVGPAADIYSAGSTLYHLVTGQPSVDLFTADASSERWKAVPEALREPLQRATSLDAANRYPTARGFAHALHEALQALPPDDPEELAWLATQRDAGSFTFGEQTSPEDLFAPGPSAEGTLVPAPVAPAPPAVSPTGLRAALVVALAVLLLATATTIVLRATGVVGPDVVPVEVADVADPGEPVEDAPQDGADAGAAEPAQAAPEPEPAAVVAAAPPPVSEGLGRRASGSSSAPSPKPEAVARPKASADLPSGGVWEGPGPGGLTWRLVLGGSAEAAVGTLRTSGLGKSQTAPVRGRVEDGVVQLDVEVTGPVRHRLLFDNTGGDVVEITRETRDVAGRLLDTVPVALERR